jgi:hypothetical protein
MPDVIFKFTQGAIDWVLGNMHKDDKQYLKHFKACLTLTGAGNRAIEVTQDGFMHRVYNYDPAKDDLLLKLELALTQLNRIMKNRTYLVPSTAVGFENPKVEK